MLQGHGQDQGHRVVPKNLVTNRKDLNLLHLGQYHMDVMQGQDPAQDHKDVMQGPDLGQGHKDIQGQDLNQGHMNDIPGQGHMGDTRGQGHIADLIENQDLVTRSHLGSLGLNQGHIFLRGQCQGHIQGQDQSHVVDQPTSHIKRNPKVNTKSGIANIVHSLGQPNLGQGQGHPDQVDSQKQGKILRPTNINIGLPDRGHRLVIQGHTRKGQGHQAEKENLGNIILRMTQKVITQETDTIQGMEIHVNSPNH